MFFEGSEGKVNEGYLKRGREVHILGCYMYMYVHMCVMIMVSYKCNHLCFRNPFNFVNGTLVSTSSLTPPWTTWLRSISSARAAVNLVMCSPLECSPMPFTMGGNPYLRTTIICSHSSQTWNRYSIRHSCI